MNESGYLGEGYARSLAEFGEPYALSRSGGWLLRRPLPGDSPGFDLFHPHPYLVCEDWKALPADLQDLDDEIASVAASPDPFGRFSLDDLRLAFPDLVREYKRHFVLDTESREFALSKDNRRRVQKASQLLQVSACAEPLDYIHDWERIFAHVVGRFGLSGIHAYSSKAFRQQFVLPGFRLWVVRRQDEIVGAASAMIHGDAAYTHLMAATDEGRQMGASYLLYSAVASDLKGVVRWIDWGGVPGSSDENSGLAAFKRGWSTDIRTTYFCGRIANRGRYDDLVARDAADGAGFFPAYRRP